MLNNFVLGILFITIFNMDSCIDFKDKEKSISSIICGYDYDIN